MRISWGGWLAIASLAGVAVGQNKYINFTSGDFENAALGSKAAVLTPSVSGTAHSFNWVGLPNAQVKEVTLWTAEGKQKIGYTAIGGPKENPPASEPTNDAGSGLMELNNGPTKPGNSQSGFQARGDVNGGGVITGTVSGDGTSGIITITDVGQLSSNYQGTLMYFEVGWSSDDLSGASFSRKFSVAQNLIEADKIANDNPDLTNNAPAEAEGTSQSGAKMTPTSTSTMTVATKSSVPGSSNGGGGDSNHSSGSAKQIGGGGLSPGAIAGIAVGAGIVGIVATVGLIWLLIRRRRRQQALAGGVSGGPYGSHGNNRTQELMAEKEANGGVDVSPHSPYSDDGNTAAAASTTAAAAGVGAAGASMSGGGGVVAHDRAFTPYSDHQRSSLVDEPPTTAPPAPAVAASHGRSTPSAAQTPYGHLVEDGMTEDDIRRLEAEERELDQAIEQAGRRS